MKKRNDIQGLRGLAITGVIAFHLFPEYFTHGFVGVDMFFVLSGYLMFGILTEKPLTKISIVLFYARRFRRIMPSYAFLIFSTMIIVPLYFSGYDIPNFTYDAKWSIALLSNIQPMFFVTTYWTKVFQYPVLLHTWSLSAEIQFYLAVPFIVIILNKFSKILHRIFFMNFLFIGSLALHLFSSEQISFGFMPSRIWQFCLGGMVVELEKGVPSMKAEEESLCGNGECEPKRIGAKLSGFVLIVLSMLILLIFLPRTNSSREVTRMIVTFLTTLVIASRGAEESLLLTNRFMLFMGDISYVLYLVHWPIIILIKYTNESKSLTSEQIKYGLAAMACTSLIMHDRIEKPFLKASYKSSLIFVLSIYLFCIYSIRTCALENYVDNRENSDTELKDVIEWNLKESYRINLDNPPGFEKDYEAYNWTQFNKYEDTLGIVYGNGTLKVLLIGNSYAYREYATLVKVFNGRFKEFRAFPTLGCLMQSEVCCPDYKEAYEKILEMSKPDITFFTAKDEGIYRTELKTDVQSDPVFKQMKAVLEPICRHSRYVVYGYQYHQTPWPSEGAAGVIGKRLTANNFYMLDLKTTWKEHAEKFKDAFARQDALPFKNLIRSRVDKSLCSEVEGICYYYNSRNLHAYYSDNGSHLTQDGLGLLIPGWTKIIDELIANVTMSH